MPMVAAEVLHTLADLAGSVKLANVGEELGAILEDRQSAIVGRLGARARMIPLELTVRGGDYGEQRFSFELVKNSDLAPVLAGVVVANALLANDGHTEKSTMLLRGTLRLRGLPDLPLETAVAGGGAVDPGLAAASSLFATLSRLWQNPFAEIDVERLDLTIEVRPEIVSYRMESVQYDRGALRPGQILQIRCALREYRGGTASRTLTLELPERLPTRGSLVLAVGNPLGIERILGDALEQRARSAADVGSLVGALADRRAAHRLTGVVFRPGGAVVARGAAYDRLPPTVEHLLSLDADPPPRQAPPTTAPLARSEQELDGPVEGVVQVRLRIDRGPGPEEPAPPGGESGPEPGARSRGGVEEGS
jgi:hypothetical protein